MLSGRAKGNRMTQVGGTWAPPPVCLGTSGVVRGWRRAHLLRRRNDYRLALVPLLVLILLYRLAQTARPGSVLAMCLRCGGLSRCGPRAG